MSAGTFHTLMVKCCGTTGDLPYDKAVGTQTDEGFYCRGIDANNQNWCEIRKDGNLKDGT